MTAFDPSRILAPLVVVMAIVLLFSSRLSTGTAKETPDGLVFPIKPIYAWSRLLVLPAYMVFFLWVAWRQNHVMPWPIIFLCLIALAISLLQVPGTITLTPMAITQRFWLQPTKTILYHEVMTIQALQGGRALLVLGDNRVRIRHSANHAASQLFRSELERRTGKRTIS